MAEFEEKSGMTAQESRSWLSESELNFSEQRVTCHWRIFLSFLWISLTFVYAVTTLRYLGSPAQLSSAG